MKKLLIFTFLAAVICSSTLGQELKPGDEIWSFRFGGSDVYSSPAVGSDGTIYVGSFSGHLHAINPDGSRKWRFKCE